MVEGKYNQDNGRIKGTINNQTLIGYSADHSSEQKCSAFNERDGLQRRIRQMRAVHPQISILLIMKRNLYPKANQTTV